MEKLCEKCGSSFDAYRNAHRFCSKECQRKAWRGPRRKWVKAPSSATCEWCKETFSPRNGKQRFCSRPCLYAHLGSSDGPSWKGGRVLHGGYVAVYAPEHPSVAHRRSGQKYVLEHRLVMEADLGRPLEKHETVHHINGDKADNRIENLQLRMGRHGRGTTHRCLDCGSHRIESVNL